MSDEERGGAEEPTWIDLDAPDTSTPPASPGSRRVWVLSAVAVIAVISVAAAVVLWPDGGADEEVSLGESGPAAPSLVALTLGGKLVQIDPATGEERNLGDLQTDLARRSVISLSPDGTTAYLGPRTGSDVEDPTILAYELPTSTGGEVVASGFHPSVSPDGRFLAYIPPIVRANQSPSVVVLGLDDGTSTEILVEEGTPNQPVSIDALAWTTDSSAIYLGFSGDQVHGGQVSPVTGDEPPVGWTAPGPAQPRPAAYLDDRTLVSVDPDGVDLGRVVAFDPAPDWDDLPPPTDRVPPEPAPPETVTSAPGSSAPYATVTPAPPGVPSLDEARELFTVDGTITTLAALPDGRALAATVTSPDGPDRPRLVRWSEDEGVVEVADEITAVTWGPPLEVEREPEPDGATTTTGPPGEPPGGPAIVAITLEGDLVALDPESGNQTRIIAPAVVDLDANGRDFGGGRELDLTVSPDGQTVYFVDEGRAQDGWIIEAVDVATGERRDITRGVSPSISPDGGTLAYADEYGIEPATIKLLDLATGEVEEVVIPEDLWEVATPALQQGLIWHPDGERLYFQLEFEASGGAVIDVGEPDAVEQVWISEELGDGLLSAPAGDQLLLAHGLVPTTGVDIVSQVVTLGWNGGERISPGQLVDPDGSSELVSDDPVFEIDGEIVDLSASSTGATVVAVVRGEKNEWELLRWRRGDGVVRLAGNIAVATWVDRLAPPADDRPATTDAPSPSTTFPPTTVPPSTTLALDAPLPPAPPEPPPPPTTTATTTGP
jgi:Tol biopolymer transport system component